MNLETLTPVQRQQRVNLRNFWFTATATELKKEIEYRENRKPLNSPYDSFSIECLKELLAEAEAEAE